MTTDDGKKYYYNTKSQVMDHKYLVCDVIELDFVDIKLDEGVSFQQFHLGPKMTEEVFVLR